MSKDSNDIKTNAIVIRRVKYEEADRILTLITPQGKIPVIAKSVRKEKSKLAGGIEMFCLSEVTIHACRNKLAILTSAKMKRFYQNLLTDFARMEAASEILKAINKASEFTDNAEFFDLTQQSLAGLDDMVDIEVVMAWFYFNLARMTGEQVNLYYDTNGEKLREDCRYVWDSTERTLRESKNGRISANEIKMMRLMLSAKLGLMSRVKEASQMASELLYIARTLN